MLIGILITIDMIGFIHATVLLLILLMLLFGGAPPQSVCDPDGLMSLGIRGRLAQETRTPIPFVHSSGAPCPHPACSRYGDVAGQSGHAVRPRQDARRSD